MRGWFLDKWSVKQKTVDRPELPFDTLAEIVGNAAVSDPLTLLQRQGQAKKLAKNVSPKPLAFPR